MLVALETLPRQRSNCGNPVAGDTMEIYEIANYKHLWPFDLFQLDILFWEDSLCGILSWWKSFCAFIFPQEVDEKTIEDDCNDVKEDMQEGCGAHGKLVMEALLNLLHCMLDLEEVISHLTIWSQATEGSAIAVYHESWVLQAANPTQPIAFHNHSCSSQICKSMDTL